MIAAVILSFLQLALTGCVQTRDLYAVRYLDRPRWASDDRPRIDISYSEIHKSEEPKTSFEAMVDSQCRDDALPAPPALSKKSDAKWADLNPRSARCAMRVAAFAVDQCEFITLHQNETSATANLVTGVAMIAGALATDAFALSGATNNKTSAAALATAVTANSSGVKGFFPANASTPVAAILAAGPAYAEAVGLADNADFNASTDGVKRPTANGRMKLARVHDAAFSNCQANAYGLRRPGKPGR